MKRSLFAFLMSGALAGAVAAQPAVGTDFQLTPRVIDGISNPPLAGAAVALETDEGFFCTGSLWRPRILATAAHCLEDDNGNPIQASSITVWAPGVNTSSAPSPVKVTDIIMDNNWYNYAEDSQEASARDFALLILNAPLGTPTWSRMATEMEVAALTWNETPVEFVGYGTTTPRVDPNAVLSPTPSGMRAFLTWGYDADLGTFKVPGDEKTGTCGGDSGGPWMSRVGSEILYLGPLSGGNGLPCDKPQPLDETYDEGAVAAANSDVTKVALSTAGEAPDAVPTTCIKGDDIRKTCWQGRAWEYDYCWPAKKAELWRWVSGDKWKRVDRFTGYKDDACGKSTPYRVIFRQIETKKNSWYEVYLPEQTGLRDGGSDPFKTTVS